MKSGVMIHTPIPLPLPLKGVVGKDYGTRFYPTMSGVLRSLNYYPIGDEEAEEGIASLALGLGKYIVDGGQTLRVCPYHPNQVLQTSDRCPWRGNLPYLPVR